MKDYCTSFPEYWLQYYLYKGWLPSVRKVYIGDCCKKHDDNCSTKVFLVCMHKKNIVGRLPIVAIASAACLLRYGKV